MSDDRSVGWQDREALHRFQMIAPLLSEDLDPEKGNSCARILQKKILCLCVQSGGMKIHIGRMNLMGYGH